MNRKYLLFLGIFVGLLLIAAAVLFFLNRQPAANQNTGNQNTNTQIVVNTNVTNTATNVQAVNEQEKTKLELSRIALSFAERFGTYSNQSDFENVESLKVFMTGSMQTWADGFVASARQQNADSSIYYGVTTKVITSKNVRFDETHADFVFTTQRIESTGTTDNNRVFFQDISIKFVKEGSQWKVNEATWLDIKA